MLQYDLPVLFQLHKRPVDKSRTTDKAFKRIVDKTSREVKRVKIEAETAYVTIHRLGFRKMPGETYLRWINSMKMSGSMPFDRDQIYKYEKSIIFIALIFLYMN